MAFAGKMKAAALAAFLGESPGNSRRIHSRWRYSVQVLPERHIFWRQIFAGRAQR
jgi:hypothetical protein